ncbi:MAG: hypothetical protein ACOX1W_01170 [Catenisphaera adipataccumulans]|jgi:hypothetical protein|uniref:hypothetical protein n=1 Tax=Catenisphaera adipataccumulans TaxID=700500 RepID=UPI003D8D2A46
MRKETRNDLWFLIPFAIWTYFSVYRWSFLHERIVGFYTILSVLCMAAIAIRELQYVKEYTKRDYIAILITLFMMYMAMRFTDTTVAYSCFLTFCARHTKFDKILKVCLAAVALSMATTLAAAYMGVILDYIMIDDDRTRHYLGFTGALVASAIYFNCAAMWCYVRAKKITWIELILLAAGAYGLYALTDSRLSFGFTCVLLVYFAVRKHKPSFLSKAKKIQIAMVFSFLFCLGLSLVLNWNYDPQIAWMYKLNGILEGRLQFAHDSLHTYGFHLLDNQIEYYGNALDYNGIPSNVGKVYNYVDCFYIQYLQKYGILFFTVLSALTTWLANELRTHKKIDALVILTIFAVHGLIDDLMFTLYFNAFWMLTGYLALPKKQRKFD